MPKTLTPEERSFRNCRDAGRTVLAAIKTGRLTGEHVRPLWSSAHYLRSCEPGEDAPAAMINQWTEVSRTVTEAVVQLAVTLNLDAERLFDAASHADSLVWHEAIVKADHTASSGASRPSPSLEEASEAGDAKKTPSGTSASNRNSRTTASHRHAPGEANAKIVSMLTRWHQYNTGICDWTEPIGVRELAKKVGVPPGTVTEFFKREFGCHRDYKTACFERTKISKMLEVLNGEIQPKVLNRPLPETI